MIVVRWDICVTFAVVTLGNNCYHRLPKLSEHPLCGFMHEAPAFQRILHSLLSARDTATSGALSPTGGETEEDKGGAKGCGTGTDTGGPEGQAHDTVPVFTGEGSGVFWKAL